MQDLLPYIQRGNTDVTWIIDYDEFNEMIDELIDSGAGPDGIPYSAWRFGGNEGRERLCHLYRHLLESGRLADDFNLSLMFFLAKGTGNDDENSAARSPSSTCPLNLSNTDAKIVALALNRSLSKVAERTVTSRQRGFIKGRNMCDNILEMEVYGMIATLMGASFPAYAFYDFSAAFASVQHAWIFFVLMNMALPGFFVHAIRQLYLACNVIVVFAGQRHNGFLQCSGIKQGCPLSGTIFALVLDPLMRLIGSRMPREPSLLTGFADD